MAELSFQLPDEKELTVQELNIGWPFLQAAAFYVGKACETQNNEYMMCRAETKDPRKCVQEAKDVTNCAVTFFRNLKTHCREDFQQYVNCLERSSGTMDFKHCRKTQAAVDRCVFEKLHIERPYYGYFCETKVHDTKRPPPPVETPITYPDRVQKMTKDDWIKAHPGKAQQYYTPEHEKPPKK